MIHRHLSQPSSVDHSDSFSKAAIDDIIVRGNCEDLKELGVAIRRYPKVREDTLAICLDRIQNEEAMYYHPQCYHLWRNFCRYIREEESNG